MGVSDIVVFLGPTLRPDAARAHLEAEYLPPVSQGDIVSVLADRPRAIGIVDGYFQLVPAVWHKEILLALDQGVAVFGAASMGALRAAELADFGMTGVGRIFRWYRSGFLEADDEVAVTHAPAELGHLPISVAMVNIRATLDRAVRRGLLSLASAVRLVDACAATPYWQRGYDRLLADGRRLGLPGAELEALARIEPVDQKRLDAVEMLQRMAAGLPAPGAGAGFRFNRTSKCEHLIDRDTCHARRGDGRLTARALVDFYLIAGHRLGGGGSLASARRGAAPGAVVALLRREGRYQAVLDAALARDRSSGLRPCEGDDRAALAAFLADAGLADTLSLREAAARTGFGDPERFIERLHRFGPGIGNRDDAGEAGR